MLKNITIKNVIEARNVLDKWLNKELPFTVSRKIQLFFKDSDMIARKYKECEYDLLKQYAELDDDGNIKQYTDQSGTAIIFKIPDENQGPMNEQLSALLNADIRYNLDEDIYFEEEDLKELQCSPKELECIDWMVI